MTRRWIALAAAPCLGALVLLPGCAPEALPGQPANAATAGLPVPPVPPPAPPAPPSAAPVSRPSPDQPVPARPAARRLAWLGQLSAAGTTVTRSFRLDSLAAPAVVAALLPRDEDPAPPDRAFSLVLADAGPRSVALCRAMVQRLEVLGPTQIAGLGGNVRPVFWMVSLDAEALAALRETRCDQLVASLDLTRNNRLGLDDMAGPKLRAIAQRQGQTIDVLWDLSDQPESEFDRAVRLWVDIMADDPLVWEPRVGRLRVIEGFRGFLIHVGAPLSNMIGIRPAGAGADPRVIRIGRN